MNKWDPPASGDHETCITGTEASRARIRLQDHVVGLLVLDDDSTEYEYELGMHKSTLIRQYLVPVTSRYLGE